MWLLHRTSWFWSIRRWERKPDTLQKVSSTSVLLESLSSACSTVTVGLCGVFDQGYLNEGRRSASASVLF